MPFVATFISDPAKPALSERTIERALLNEQNELGPILDRSVDMDKIPNLMQTMLA